MSSFRHRGFVCRRWRVSPIRVNWEVYNSAYGWAGGRARTQNGAMKHIDWAIGDFIQGLSEERA